MAVPITLKVYKGEELLATKDYDRDIIKIGRLSSAHLCLDDEKVSRIHSVIEVAADGSISIIDMGSVEGTYVNGKRVNKGALQFGDEIRVGGTTIKLDGKALSEAAQSGSTDVADQLTDPSAPAAGLQAAAQAAPVAEAAPAAAPAAAIDSSFANTERNDALPPEQGAYDAAPALPARHLRKKGSGPLGCEIRMMWGDQMVAEHFLRPLAGNQAFTVGPQGHFVMGDELLPSPRFDVVRKDNNGFTVRFTKQMKGELHRGEEVMDLMAAIEGRQVTNDGECYALTLDKDDFIAFDLGGVRIEVCLQPVPKTILIPLSESIDFTVLNIFLVTFFLAALFVITAMNQDMDGSEYADELSGNQARIAKLIIKPPDVEKKNPLLEKLNKQKAEKSGEIAAKQRGTEGSMGKKDAAKKSAHAAPQGKPDNKDVARNITQKIFGQGGGVSTVFGKAGLGGELKAAVGNMFGSAPGDAAGFGGLGLRGSGGGGGGTGDTIGIGGIGTKGRGGGTGSYGDGVGKLGGKASTDIGITSSEPTVMGSLDKELIRQVVKRNQGQIRYCYESALTRNPKLHGKVTVKWVISATGSVASSSIASSTAGNAELETCVAGRVRTWMFPKPKGGGVVVVSYPFIFKQSGE